MGNPVLEYATDFNSRAEFFWSHGLISDSTYKLFTTGCNYSRYVSEYYRDSISPLCSKVMKQVSRETSKFVDKYDVTLDVCISSVLSQSKAICPQSQVSLLSLTFPYECYLYHFFTIILLVIVFSNCLVHYVLKNIFPSCQTANKREHRCMCRWQSYKLLKPKRCTRGTPCQACWSSKVECLQHVISSKLEKRKKKKVYHSQFTL